MPNPLDYLRQAFNAANTSFIPQEWVDAGQEAIDSPSLDRSPTMARIAGFGAGAMQGLRDQLTPMMLASSALGLGGAGQAARGAGQAASAGSRAMRAVRPTIDILEDAPPVRQVKGSMSMVDDLIDEMGRNLEHVPNRGAARSPVAVAARERRGPISAGMRDPRLTAVGDEAAFNANRAARMPATGDARHGELVRRFGGRGR